MKIVNFISLVILLNTVFGCVGYGFNRIKNEKDVIGKELGCIHLIGELHNDENDINQKKLLIELSKSNELILALEGEDKDLNETIFGLEELRINSIGSALMLYVDLFRHMLYKKMISVSGDINRVSSLKSGYSKKFRNPEYIFNDNLTIISSYLRIAVFEKRDSKEYAFFESQVKINKLLEVMINYRFGQDASIMNFIGKNTVDDNFYDNISNGPQDFYVLLRRIVAYWKKELTISSIMPNALLLRLKHMLIDFDKLYADIENSKSQHELNEIMVKLTDIQKGIVNQITLDLRNEIFLDKICSAYEKTQNVGKPFFVVVGIDHIPFLEEKLSQKGYRVQVNNRARKYLNRSEL